jgi:hypothetical protein
MARLTRRFHVPSAVRSSPFRIPAVAARALIAEGALVMDVRRRDDDSDGPEGAVRISPDLIPGRVAALSTDVPIVLGCT